MIANAAGVPLLLQASNVHLQDLIGSLTPGDAVKGRVVELLPQNQALINVRGQNVVAQLPAGTSLAKGDLLSLLVSQTSAGEGTTAAGLVLKLMSVIPAGSTSPVPAPSASTSAPLTPGFTQLEQALASAKLPVNSVNLALAQTLSRLGVPLDPQTLQSLSQSVESLIANEQMPSATNATVLADPVVQQALQEGLAQINLGIQLSPSGQTAVGLMQAARGLEDALQGLGATGSAPQPGAPSGQDWAAQIGRSVQLLLDDPSQAQIQNLNVLLGQAAQSTLSPASSPNANPIPTSALGLSNLAANSADIPAMREALAQWLGPMNQAPQGQSAAALAQSAQSLSNTFGDSAQGATQRLIAAVQAQSPESSLAAIQSAASGALQQVADFYGQLPAGRVLPGVQSIQSDLTAQGLPVPRADLSTLAPETVADAVAWLNARGFPPQRPLVETVAGWMAQDGSSLPVAHAALQGQAALSDGIIASQPGLKNAYASLARALDASGVNPEGDGLSGRLQAWASAQGLSLESELATGSGLLSPMDGKSAPASPLGPGSSAPAGPAMASLRGALLNLEHQLNQALQSTATSALSSTDAAGLNSALKLSQAAVRGFNALPLQAQGAPAFDTVHLPMPVWMNGVMGDGRLSVTWRNGRERSLDDKEPVNIAVQLDTESLGPVTVSLQVWKDAASVRVLASDKANAAFLAQGADDLRDGFAANTPFALRSLDFTVAQAKAAPQAAGADVPALGLSLRA